MTIYLILVAFTLLIVSVPLKLNREVITQPSKTNLTNSVASDTFSMIGTINSLVITVPQSGFNITNAFKVILTEGWDLDVHNGTVTNFAANFLASPMDGTKGHIHQ